MYASVQGGVSAIVTVADAIPSIVNLPDDVICYIFKFCRPHTPVRVLSSICGRFRAIALHTPSLWTTIRFHIDECTGVPPRFERDATYLKRSREARLDVQINWARSSDSVGSALAKSRERQRWTHWLSQSDVHRALRLLWPHIDRIHTLVVRCELYFPLCRLAEIFARRSAPALEVLELVHCGSVDDNTLTAPRLALFTGGMPILKQLTLHDVHWDWDESPLGGRNLRTLHLTYMHPSMCPTMPTMSRLIGASPNLEELTLVAAGPHVDAIPAGPCVARSLRSLTLGHASTATLDALARVTIGNALRTLVLTGLAGLPYAPTFARAPIAYLTLHRISVAPCIVVDFLRVGFPQLKSLALREVHCTSEVLHGIARRGSAVCPKLTKLKIGGDVDLEDVRAFLVLRARAGVGIEKVCFEARDKVDKPASLQVETQNYTEAWTEECSAGALLEEASDRFAQDLIALWDD